MNSVAIFNFFHRKEVDSEQHVWEQEWQSGKRKEQIVKADYGCVNLNT